MHLREREHPVGDVCFTTATPFSDDGTEVDHEGLRANLEFLDDHGARVYIPCGNTGEYYSLSDTERAAVVKTHVETVGDDGTVIGGAAGSTKKVIALIDRYEAAGADGVMVMHPDHTHVHEQGLKRYYRQISEVTDLDIVVYKRGPEVSTEVLAEIAAIDNVVGIKYADDDLKTFSRAVDNIDANVVWINGIAERYAPAFTVEGATGFTTGIGNFAPQAPIALYQAFVDGDIERAKQIRNAIRPFERLRDQPGSNNTIGSANNVPAIKYGMDLVGLNGGPVREPLVDLSSEDAQLAEEYLEQLQAAKADWGAGSA